MEKRIKFTGYIEFLNIFKTNLIRKKKMDGVSDYGKAKRISLNDIATANELDLSLLEMIVSHVEQLCNIEKWFNEL